jgi:hypothetical protein
MAAPILRVLDAKAEGYLSLREACLSELSVMHAMSFLAVATTETVCVLLRQPLVSYCPRYTVLTPLP